MFGVCLCPLTNRIPCHTWQNLGRFSHWLDTVLRKWALLHHITCAMTRLKRVLEKPDLAPRCLCCGHVFLDNPLHSQLLNLDSVSRGHKSSSSRCSDDQLSRAELFFFCWSQKEAEIADWERMRMRRDKNKAATTKNERGKNWDQGSISWVSFSSI